MVSSCAHTPSPIRITYISVAAQCLTRTPAKSLIIYYTYWLRTHRLRPYPIPYTNPDLASPRDYFLPTCSPPSLPPPPPPPPRKLFTIMRDRLMQILAEGLPSSVVRTRREVVSVEESPSGATLRFEDGSAEGPFDLVVGADGIKGAARKAVRAGRGGGGSGGGGDAVYSGIRIQYGVAPAGQRPKG